MPFSPLSSIRGSFQNKKKIQEEEGSSPSSGSNGSAEGVLVENMKLVTENITNTSSSETPQQMKMKVIVDEQVFEDYKINKNDLIGSIDQGTSSSRFLVFTKAGRILASAQMEHRQIFPPGEDKVGWHEHDPLEIWKNTMQCIEGVGQALEAKGVYLATEQDRLAAVGITNQRETTLAWNKETGVPYYNAVVWDDLRTTRIASDIAKGNKDLLRDKTGLPLASYFAGTKVKWLLDNVPALQKDLIDPEKRDNVAFGTIDSWLSYQLTGTKQTSTEAAANCNGRFVTDVTNASRWLFMDLRSQTWDPDLIDTVCHPHSVPVTALPEICPSSHSYGVCKYSDCGIAVLDGVPLASILGDQQAALFGQTAFAPGKAKNTYGTGLFLMMNTGTKVVPSLNGLLTTVAYQIGNEGAIHYALEGSVSHAGSTIQWLRDQLKIIQDAPESEILARTTEHNDGMYFVPAFAGLFAPHWRSDARACMVGMTATHHSGHVCRAALEAAAYQTREVFDAIKNDSNVELLQLAVDGGGSNNTLMMQFQADMLNVPVVKPVVTETTGMGAAFCAGLTVGVYKNLQEIEKLWTVAKKWEPQMQDQKRDRNWAGWQKAITKSLGWIENDSCNNNDDGGDDNGDGTKFNFTSLALTATVAVCAGFALGKSRR